MDSEETVEEEKSKNENEKEKDQIEKEKEKSDDKSKAPIASITPPSEKEVMINGRLWRLVEGNFTMVTASLVHSIAIECKAAPYAHIGDGLIDLVFSTSDVSKFDMAQYFLSLADSNQNVTNMQYRKVKALVVESLSEKGRFALDGELAKYSPIKCVVVPRLLNILGALP